MTEQEFFLPIRFPSQNQVINWLKSRRGMYIYTAKKKDFEEMVHNSLVANHILPMGKVLITFTWVEPDRRRDYDNVTFAQKFVLDALKSGGIIEDDRRSVVKRITHEITDWVSKDAPGVFVKLEEA